MAPNTLCVQANALRTIAALFVEPNGPYAGLPGVELWDLSRDARLYDGPYPVVAHPVRLERDDSDGYLIRAEDLDAVLAVRPGTPEETEP